MKNNKNMLIFITFLAIVSLLTIIFKPTKLGLDLIGGTRLVLEAQTTDSIKDITPTMMDSLQFAIEKRVNALGVAETVVQRSGDKRLIVEIPNISSPEQAKKILGETAELEFKKQDSSGNWVNTGLSGNDLKKATVGSDPTTGEWMVMLEFNDKGTKKFADITSQLVGKPMAIFFNKELQSAPYINEPILGGKAQITGGQGGFEFQAAKEMVDLLNAGALPIPAKIIEENTIGPTLGADSIQKSKIAGIIGIGCVMLFMFLYYHVPGLIADVALVLYGLFVFAIFKTIPITLTLAGIAGFILSIGMAVDANVLIFERTKEELRRGRSLFAAINAGFDRAFTSIFDSNMTTIISCAILYYLGSSIVKGFALTLAIGVIVSMFSAITITKNLMHVIFDAGKFSSPLWFGVREDEITNKNPIEQTKARTANQGILD